jgi:hypothetical protein
MSQIWQNYQYNRSIFIELFFGQLKITEYYSFSSRCNLGDQHTVWVGFCCSELAFCKLKSSSGLSVYLSIYLSYAFDICSLKLNDYKVLNPLRFNSYYTLIHALKYLLNNWLLVREWLSYLCNIDPEFIKWNLKVKYLNWF